MLPKGSKVAMKLTWTVSPAPTGPHRSFRTRSWPSATVNNQTAFCIRSVSGRQYTAQAAITPVATDLKIHVAVWRKQICSLDPEARTFDWRVLKGAWSTLAEAKAHVEDVLKRNPGLLGDMPPVTINGINNVLQS